MRLNTAVSQPKQFTHEGAPAARTNASQQLRRSVFACLLWEDEFYEDGESIAARITKAAMEVDVRELASLAIEARSRFNLRHVPLLLLSVLADRARGNRIVSDAIYRTIQRADELAELLAVYAKYKGTTPDKLKKIMPHGLRRGLALAFGKFNAYALAKYNRDNAIKLRDVLFLSHAKPRDTEQAAIWKQLIDGTLASPDTWEVELSAGKDKRATFERLIREGKLGYFALLRNLRNMAQANVDDTLIREAVLARKGGAERILPFRFIAAARAAKQFERELDTSMQASVEQLPRLKGKTFVLVDVSGSMNTALSAKSDMTRMDAAAALGAIINADAVRVFTFSTRTVEVPPRRGMAGVDAIIHSQGHGGTDLGGAVRHVRSLPHDRLIVITDEQSHTQVAPPGGSRNYLINVASYKNGVGYGHGWTHIDGFSENVLRYIHELESASCEPKAG